MKITYVDHGIGNNFGDEIELNKDLLKYPELHEVVLNHELSHTDKLFSLKDLSIDLTENNIDLLSMLKFMIKHPKSFTQILPFYYTKKHGFVYDINLIIIYLFMIFFISVTILVSVYI